MIANQHHHLCPRTVPENLAFRKDLINWGSLSKANGKAIKHMCSEDLLFWVNAFCWTYDPRLADVGQNPVVPFVTYDYQDEIFTDVNDCIGKTDICFKKSRDMGLSWIILTLFTWRWCFREMESYLLVSRNEDYVDKPGNPKCLFWKIDFLLDPKRMPGYLIPKYTRTKLRFTNEDTGSMIDGESTTGDVARGDRRTAIGLDEMAAFDVDAGYQALSSTLSSTRCRIFNSTPKGMGNAFADIAHSPHIKSISVHWSQHPDKKPGLYQSQPDGSIDYIDEAYWDEHGLDYPFIKDGKLRSPWYDEECRRAISPQEIASELDIDFHGSETQFFPPGIISRHSHEHVVTPFVKGELDYDIQTGEPIAFVEHPDGRLKLWFHLDAGTRPAPEIDAVVAGDIGTGTGASNSVLVVGNRLTHEKIAEFASPNMRPEELGILGVALARWFAGPLGHGALMIWEANGPGRAFGSVVLDLGYRHIYYRRTENRIGNKPTDYPGWVATKDTKRVLLTDYRRALQNDAYINHSREALEECKHYIFLPNQDVVHSRSISTIDASGARDNHGDRVIADALCCRGMGHAKVSKRQSQVRAAPGSLAWRRMEAEQEARAKDWW